MANNIVAIYAGRFHPFHKGHKAVYDSLVGKFGADKVFIATSGKQNDTDSPFSFKEKAAMMMLTGVPGKAISQETSPYKPENILKKFSTDTAVVFAVGKKDMDESPRFKPGLKKDGSPTYYQTLDGKKVTDLEGYEKHGYLIVAPTVKFTVLGEPATSASELRARYGKLDDEQRGKFIEDLFGSYNDVIQKVLDTRLGGVTERKLSGGEKRSREANFKKLKKHKGDFEKQYGDDAESVMYAVATKRAKGESVEEATQKPYVSMYRDKDNKNKMVYDVLDKNGNSAFKSYDEREATEYFKKNYKNMREAYPNKPTVPEFGNRIFGGDKGIIVKQIKRLVDVIKDLGELQKNGSVDKETMAIILSQLEQIGDYLKDTPVEESFRKMIESLYNLNKQDPMDSEIIIQGLGRMTLQQAVRRVKEYADEISAVASKEPWIHQNKLTHHIDMLGHYNKAVQDAYKDLAKIRKKGGTRSKGIDPDLSEAVTFDTVEGIK
ncbi:MAG: hypothetical protein CMA64_09090 [Euryarchaeota archaeon]|nr:hypothetical protein [Euryarchaeota archaeon]